MLDYHILNPYDLNDSDQLKSFLLKLKLRLTSFSGNRYSPKRIDHMNGHIDALIETILNYADVYCFFDRMSLGDVLTIFTGLDNDVQNCIFANIKKFDLNFNADQVPDFIKKVFCLISIRNCVMHCNSLEILTRYYDPATHTLRKVSDKKRYQSMIKNLCIEKPHIQM